MVTIIFRWNNCLVDALETFDVFCLILKLEPKRDFLSVYQQWFTLTFFEILYQ